MARKKLTPLQLQIRRVWRRLYWQTLLDTLAWCCTAALGAAMVWFFIEYPLVFAKPAIWWQRWAIAGGLLGGSSFLALLIAWLRAPSLVQAALEMDGRFHLKERVTTSLLLSASEKETPAGQALLADVDQHIQKLSIGEQFAVRPPRHLALVPVAVVLLAAVALFYHPTGGRATSKTDPDRLDNLANVKEIGQKVASLKKPAAEPAAAKPKSDKLQELENELDKIAKKPMDNKEQLRDRVKELTEKQNEAQQLEQNLNDKDQKLKQQLRQLERLAKKSKDSPANKLQDALEKGDFKEAKEEAEKLRERLGEKEFEKGGLTEAEKKKLEEQLQNLQEQMDRLAQNKQKEEELKKLFQEGKIDKKTLDKELAQLKKEAQAMKELKKLADALKECKECLAKGNVEDAMEALQKAADELEKMEGGSEELKALKDKIKEMMEAKEAMCKALSENQGQMAQAGPSGPNNGGEGAGPREESGKVDTDSVDSRERGVLDTKGQVIHSGYAPGRNYRKKPSAEIEGDIKQAAQEAPEAIERQKIPRDARKMTRGYFQNLNNQK